MTAKTIIDEILVNCNLAANISPTPFEDASVELIEIRSMLNRKLTEIGTEREFQQIKKTLDFQTYSIWEATTSKTLGQKIQNEGSRYECTTAGTTGSVLPNFTDTTTVDGTVVWTYRGSADEYPLSDLMTDFDTPIDNTFFNITNQTQLTRLTDEEWQRKRALSVSEFSTFYKFQGDSIWLYPTYSPEHTITFQYYSTDYVVDSTGATKTQFTANEDVTPIDEDILIWGTATDWLTLKGLPQSVWARTHYDQQLQRRKATSQPNRDINLDGATVVNSNIAEGSW